MAARLEASRAQVKVAESGLAMRKNDYDDLQVRAPFAGVVISKDAQPGEIVSPMSAGGGFTRTGIATIVDLDSREVEVDVNEAYINRVKSQSARRGHTRCVSRTQTLAGARDQHRADCRPNQGDSPSENRLRQARAADPARHGHQGALSRLRAGGGLQHPPGPRIRVPSVAVQRVDGSAFVWRRRAMVASSAARSRSGPRARARSKCWPASTAGEELGILRWSPGLEDGGKVELSESNS